ncbi:MAG TPA: tRNA pseudouridine(55) synthase TruB [Gemmatimonadales bacterium]|jgi:tRNA pseudouridine55 synthase
MTGGLLIDKPAGWTSHDVVAAVRRTLGTRAVGHAGTLDPFATGLLVVLVGKATRLARYVEALAKVYRATVCFGTATDTEDSTGTVIARRTPETWPTEGAIQSALATLVGSRPQRPPAFSAKHVAGTRSHELARTGKAVELAEVQVHVHQITVDRWSPPELDICATVGRGTYLRSLARELGEVSGIPAHCAVLRRLAIGPFSVNDAMLPGEVDRSRLMPAAALLPTLPSEQVDDGALREIAFGRAIAQQRPHQGPGALVADDGRLIAAVDGREGRWHPVVVFEAAT